MALDTCTKRLNPFSFKSEASRISTSVPTPVLLNLAEEPSKQSLQISAESPPKARFLARWRESVTDKQLQRPFMEWFYRYSVLDGERIKRLHDSTFRCYVSRSKFFAFEVCPFLLVRVEEQPSRCCIKLLSCKLLWRINVFCDSTTVDSPVQQLTSDAVIEVNIEICFASRVIPAQAIEPIYLHWRHIFQSKHLVYDRQI